MVDALASWNQGPARSAIVEEIRVRQHAHGDMPPEVPRT